MKKVIIIGGGISGLATAWLLREKALQAGLELDLALLEKEEQPGGKIRTIREQGLSLRMGPQRFSGQQASDA